MVFKTTIFGLHRTFVLALFNFSDAITGEPEATQAPRVASYSMSNARQRTIAKAFTLIEFYACCFMLLVSLLPMPPYMAWMLNPS